MGPIFERVISQKLKTSKLKQNLSKKHNTILQRWTKLSFLDLWVDVRNHFAGSTSEITLRRS